MKRKATIGLMAFSASLLCGASWGTARADEMTSYSPGHPAAPGEP